MSDLHRPPAVDAASHGAGVYYHGYFLTRLRHSSRRASIWRHVARFLERWIPADGAVLELGAGWCDFANTVTARRVAAMDLDRTVLDAAAPHVEASIGDCTDLSRFAAAEFDVVFASNLLEHLDRSAAILMLAESARVLRPTGRLVLVQPNYRLNPAAYFDDFTHVSVYSDRSLPDFLVAHGWSVEHVQARFLPLTMKSRLAGLSSLVPVYLRSPVRPFAGQMLVVATPAGH